MGTTLSVRDGFDFRDPHHAARRSHILTRRRLLLEALEERTLLSLDGADFVESPSVLDAIRRLDEIAQSAGVDASAMYVVGTDPGASLRPGGGGATPTNLDAAHTTRTDVLQSGDPPLNVTLTGDGYTVGVWEASEGDGKALIANNHPDLNGRVTLVDVGGNPSDHATHVAGTIGAAGNTAPGMATEVQLRSFDAKDDLDEMQKDARTRRIVVSNHSYSSPAGWMDVPLPFNGKPDNGTGEVDVWSGSYNLSTTEDNYFGKYRAFSRGLDDVLYDHPDLLSVWAAGNDRDEVYGNLSGDDEYFIYLTEDLVPPLDDFHGPDFYRVSAVDRGNGLRVLARPPQDGGATGYDTLPDYQTAKNSLVVGAVEDIGVGTAPDEPAAPGTPVQFRSDRIQMTPFSSWGPTDDGRIKPDVVANGDNVLSTIVPRADGTMYAGMEGTSYAAPGVAGTAVLLIEHYNELHLYPEGSTVRSATTKGLLIHTATDAGTVGPDYQFGWGLINGMMAVDFLTDSFYDTENRNGGYDVLVEDTYQAAEMTWDFYYDGTTEMKATVVWTDPAGPTHLRNTVDQPDSVLVNDLDLWITDSTGRIYYPWRLLDAGNVGNPADPARRDGANHLDNVEQVLVDAGAAAGRYTIHLSHTGNLEDPRHPGQPPEQPFTMLISGVSGGTISGQKTDEKDGSGLAGWKIYVDEDDDGEWAPDEPFDVTDADGNYEIMGVRAGLHTVAEVAQDGWLQTFPPAGTHGVFLDAASAGGMVVTGLDFRNQELDEPPITVEIIKFEDTDGDEKKDDDEPPLSGFKIYVDKDGDGEWDDDEIWKLTDSEGKAEFVLPQGEHTFAEVPGPGYDPTYPTSAHPIECVSMMYGDVVPTGNSESVAISADGRYVAFLSVADLVPGTPAAGGQWNVYLFDRHTLTMERVSMGMGGAAPDDASGRPAISGDGRYVVFSSLASNLVANDTNGEADLFLWDRQTKAIRRLNVGPGGEQSDGTDSWDRGDYSISADGSSVAFTSNATNLTVEGNSGTQVYVSDIASSVTERVSVGPGNREADGPCFEPALSAGGRYVAFSSSATTLVPGAEVQRIRFWDVSPDSGYYKLRINGTEFESYFDTAAIGMTALRMMEAGEIAGLDFYVTVISDTEPYEFEVEFRGESQGIDFLDIEFVPSSGSEPLSASFSATEICAGDPKGDMNIESSMIGNILDVFVYDRLIGHIERISNTPDGKEPDGWSGGTVAMSADGRIVAFNSWATDLGVGGADGPIELYVVDRTNGAIENYGNHDTIDGAALSADGRYLVFDSMADEIVPEDTDGDRDVFRCDRSTGVIELMSLNSDGTGSTASDSGVSVSADGRFVGLVLDGNAAVGGYPDGWNCFVVDTEKVLRQDAHTVVLGRGAVVRDALYMGNTPSTPGEIHGRKFYDENRNGIHNGGEPGLRDWVIYLDLDEDGFWDWGEPSTITDADGVYAFTNLAVGTYTVAEQGRIGWEQTAPVAPGTYTVELDPGDVVTGRDFGNSLPPVVEDPIAAIYGAKWQDSNGDGLWDDGEPGLEGWTIYLDTNRNGRWDDGEPFEITDEGGFYDFQGLEGGTYVVAEIPRDRWQQTYPDSPGTHTVTVPAYTWVDLVDFGNRPMPNSAAIRGVKWNDLNGDGVWAVGEPGLQGWRVYVDANEDGIWQEGEAFAITETDGSFVLAGLPAGAHRVVEEQQAGWGQTYPGATAHVITVADATTSYAAMFGNYETNGLSVIQGVKFGDLNGNRVRDGGEPGLSGWKIYLDIDRSGVWEDGEPFAFTAADGSFRFIDLEPGDYVVAEELRPNWEQTYPEAPGTHTLTLNPDEVATADFGNRVLPGALGEIRGSKWDDSNGNGKRDLNEPGLPDWTIYLDLNENGVLDHTQSEWTLPAVDVPEAIPDSATITSTVEATGLAGPIVDVDVVLNITHASPSDLDVFLGAPDGTWVELFTNAGPGGTGFVGTRLDDEATDVITQGDAPFTGSHRPEEPLSVLDGKDPNGEWTLRILDDTQGGDGTLDDWSLILTTGAAEPWTETEDDGTYLLAGIPAGAYRVTEEYKPSWLQTYPESTLDLEGKAIRGAHEITFDPSNPAVGLDFGNYWIEPYFDLGGVDFRLLETLDPTLGALWYRCETLHGGLLTIEGLSNEAEVALYDGGLLQLDNSVLVDDTHRIDQQVGEAETYYIRLAGTATDVDLRLSNLVEQVDGEVTVYDTAGNDTQKFSVNASYMVTVNGVEYDVDKTTTNTFHFLGGTGMDQVYLYDTPGDEIFEGWSDHTSFSGDGFTVETQQMDAVYAYAREGGTDKAFLRDSSSDDKFKGYHDLALLRGGGVYRRAKFFDEVHAYASDAEDTAIFYDTDGNDKFKSDAGKAYARMNGFGYLNRAKFFEEVIAYADHGHDVAVFKDSDDADVFRGFSHKSQMYGDGYEHTGKGFDEVVAWASGGFDKVRLYDTTGNDKFVFKPHKGEVTGPALEITARGFDKVNGFASDGDDLAKIYDTDGDDLLEVFGDTARLSTSDGVGGWDLLCEAIAFEQVRAYGTSGGENTKQETALLEFLLQMEGDWL